MGKLREKEDKMEVHPPVFKSNGHFELRPPNFVSNDDEGEDANAFPGGVDLSVVYANMSKSEFGPGTINSDDEGGEDSDEDTLKIADVEGGTDFFEGFKTDYNYSDTWDTIISYLKPKTSIDVKDTVNKVMLREKEAKKIKKQAKKDNNLANDDDDDDASSDDDLDFGDFKERDLDIDKLKLKESEAKRIQKIKAKKVVEKKTPEQLEIEKEEAKYFETAIPCEAGTTFLEMNFSRQIMKAIEGMGYRNPTPIQATTIPIALQGRDICGCAATGTGKTAAYMLPILERLLFKPKEDLATRVLVLLPTRELGIQVFEVTKEMSKFTSITVALCVGGLDLQIQENALRQIPDIVIATPGRLIDHLLNAPNFHMKNIEILVLDEADRMLEENFEEQMREIIKQCSKTRQTMLFSATMTSQVRELAIMSLKDPVKVFINNNTDVAQNLRQEFVRLHKGPASLREAVLAYLVLRCFRSNTIIFTPTKVLAHRVHILLTTLGVQSGELHGDLKQTERVLALKNFKDGKIDALVATDVAARGLDIVGVQTVINFTVPAIYSRYVHRVGRTARAGRCGRSVSIVGDKEFKMLKDIRKLSKTALYERVLDKNILAKIQTKLYKMKPIIQQVMEEEEADKQLRRVENALSSIEKRLDNPERERVWMDSKDGKPMSKSKKRRLKEKLRSEKREEGEENEDSLGPPTKKQRRDKKRQQNREVGGKAGKARMKMKTLKCRDQDEQGGYREQSRGSSKLMKKNKPKGQGGGKTSFSQELTSISKRSLKKFRGTGASMEGVFRSNKGKKQKQKK
ncbi:probable ATP-dependent RNA helicase DDX27 [Penaeus japonicus]|uniref:probable ATP-dependent RNA helicase DDX27 n=1 Tax=Penaeus japonicus TaxID=27405 RepID=UPI001C7132AC|nr:probable ATP-dependent RNA helicase DDX27 [Penaeus japonicus]